MAVGDQQDMFERLLSYLPSEWFGELHPDVDALMRGYAAIAAKIYQQTAYARQQTRIATSTDFFLELINKDFLSGKMPRHAGESDATYRFRLQINIIRPKNTRQAYIKVLEDLTGITPIILEGWYPQDTNALNNPTLPGGFILNVSSLGTWQPYHFIIIAFSPVTNGVAVNGLNSGSFSLNNPAPGTYGMQGFVLGAPNPIAIIDADIIQAINFVRTAGVTVTVYLNDNVYILPTS